MSDHPHSLDRFQILRILGKGGMGTVYLARDERLGRSVALKVLNSEDLASDEVRGKFLREARAAAAIRHPNVATIFEVGETGDGQPFIVMEYCEGETLAQRIRRAPLGGMEFLSAARQIAAALAAAHQNGVVHRDMKAANIIMEPTGTVKILDFGLARLLPRDAAVEEKFSHDSTSSGFFGTIHYLSPEQARGLPADARSDLFSAGVVLYEMASGRLPFAGSSPLTVLERIRDAEPDPFAPFDPGFPAGGAKVIGRLLQKAPQDRYQSANELCDDLTRIETATARVPDRAVRSSIGRTLRTPHRAQIAVIVLAVVALAAGVYFTRQQGSVSTPASLPTEQAVPQGPIRSIAVLPLANLANSASDEFLSVGLADALITKLQQIPSVQVRPTSSVLQFRSTKVDAKTAGKRLQVDGVLEGHFLAAGDLVRVNLQLTDARSGYSVWAQSIDGRRADLLQLIDEVSTRTVAGVSERLGMRPVRQRFSEPRSSNAAAYEQYIKARALTGSLLPRDYEAQTAALRRATALDPNFAAAHADLAIALSLGQSRSLTSDPDALKKAEGYARRAVRLDPYLPVAHVALSRAFTRQPGRFRESVREGLAALRLDPNQPDALFAVASYLVADGEIRKAECLIDQLLKVDPSSNDAKTRGYMYINSIDPGAALRSAQYALAAKETQLAGHDMRSLAYLMLNNLRDAELETTAVTSIAPDHYAGKSLRAMLAAARGDRRAAEQAIRTFEQDANRIHWAAIRVALAYARLGDKEKALAWVERSAELGHHTWFALVKHPWFSTLQSEPRFVAVVAQIKRDLDDVSDDVAGVYPLVCK